MWGPLLLIAAVVAAFAAGVYFGLKYGRKTARLSLDDLYDVWGDASEEAL